MAAQKVKQREEKNPDDVHKVPVEAEHFDWRVIVRCVPALRGTGENHNDQADADDHVQRMQSRHTEIKRKKELGVARIGTGEMKGCSGHVVVSKFIGVLDDFNA